MQKTLLLSTAVIIGVGVCAVLLWKAPSERAGVAELRGASANPSAPAAAGALDGLPVEANSRVTDTSGAAPPTRATAAREEPAQVELTTDVVGLAAAESDSTAASLADARFPENHLFAEKYASSSARERQDARDAIEALLLTHKSGMEEKGQGLTDQQVAELGHEIDWLQANANP